MTLEEDEALAHPEHWNSRYTDSQGEEPTHEWLLGASDLEPFFTKHLFGVQGLKVEDNPLILHLGSGDSVIPVELSARGYRQQLCVDFSKVVVKLMEERHQPIEGIKWREMDVRNMVGVSDGSVDVAFDKSTLDAMVHGSPWNPPDSVKENIRKYLNEVHRVLKTSGVFLYITFRQPHFIQLLVNANDLWDIEMQTLGKEGSFGYYGYVLTKHSAVP